jgi:two-component system cell cycle sensor histidine kinase/response regulator CckA
MKGTSNLSEEEYRTVIDGAVDGYLLVDADGRILEVNEAYSRMTGYPVEELVCRTIADLEADESSEEVADTIRDVLDAGAARFERRQRRRDGTLIDLDISVRSLGEGSRRLCCFVRDITRRKQSEAERELGLRLMSLSGRTGSLDEFMAGATALVREWLKCDLVGINVRDGAVMRHFENHGDPPCFVASESMLCPLGSPSSPGPATAEEGVGCLCTRVLAGGHRGQETAIYDGAPGFTPRGSYWTASGVEGEEVSSGEAGGSRCRLGAEASAGWQSVALVPLLSSHSAIGLMQLLDRRPGRWDAAAVGWYERLADQIAVAAGQHLAQEALRTSEARYRTLFEGMTHGVVIQDADGRVIAVNPAAERMLGLMEGEAVGRISEDTRWGAVGEDGSPLAGAEHPSMLALRRGEPVRKVVMGVMNPARGERVWLEVTAVPQFRPGGGRPYQVFTTFEEITRQKQAEEALRASESSYRGLFNTIRLALYIQDSRGRFLDVNDGAVAMYGYAREELLGRTPDFLSAPGRNDLAALGEHLRKALAGEPQRFEFWGRRRNGEVFPKEVRLYRGTYHGQEVLIAVAADVSESRDLEERVRQLQKMDAIGQLAGGIAHDFNNLLAAMTLQIGLLEARLAGDPKSLGDLRELGEIAARAAGMTRQLLTFSRQTPLQRRVVSLNAVVEELATLLGRLLGETIELEVRGAPGLPAIQADAPMIQQVLLNLCVNARDAMPAGGRLVIRTAACVLDRAAAAANPEAREGSFVVLEVRDNGCGMDAETRRRVFEPFFTSKEPGRGTGLGLSIVYGIIRQHGGWIEVESEAGQGTRFRAFFPECAGTPEDPAPVSSPRPVGGRERLLLVEDNEALRRSLGTFLAHLGYTVLEAGDGPEALRAWDEAGARIDLVLTDMVMPSGMSGLELAGRLRARRPELPIIVSSGYSAELETAGGASTEHVAFLSKPYSPHELAVLIRRCLEHPPVGSGPEASAD